MQYLKNIPFKHLLAIISVLGIFTLIGVLETHPVPIDNRDVVNISIGALIGGLIAKVGSNYFPAPTEKGGDRGDKKDNS